MGDGMSAVLARRFGRALLIVALVFPLAVSGFADRILGGQVATAASAPSGLTPVPSPPGLGPELVELRSRTSRTFAPLDLGPNATLISQSSLNYRASDGSWRPIDTTLVSAAGGGYENRANSLRFRLPQSLAEPVRVEDGEHWLSFALVGASAQATATVSGAGATYGNVLPGVSVKLEARNDFLKESIVLAGPEAAAALTFRVRHSSGLAARKDQQGGIELVDAQGGRRLGFAAPFMYDASGERSGFSRAVAVAVTPERGGFELVLTPDPGWLADPARRWPVTIDPTTGGPYTDCTLTSGSAAGTSFCAAQTLQVGFDGRISRSLSTWNLGALPPKSYITLAELKLYLHSSSAGAAASIGVHRQTRTHTINATWNTYDGTNAWTTAGGDFNATAEHTNPNIGPSVGWYSWYPTKLVQGWYDGSIPNQGMLLKASNEAAANLLTFASYDAALGEPQLWTYWLHHVGEQPYFKFESQPVSDQIDLSVNIANGNLLLNENDIDAAGIGLDLALTRTNNSLDANTRRFGRGRSWIQGLAFQADSSILYFGTSGEWAHLVNHADGSYRRPMGFDATFVKNPDGTYTLTDHATSVKEHFRADGRLTSIVDPNGNTLTYLYNGNGFPFEVRDTQGRQWNIRYNAANLIDLVSTTSKPGGGTWFYEYDIDGNLVRYTNPAGGVTSYGYSGGRLTSVTTPAGRQASFSYDSNGRVLSVSRGTIPFSTTNFTYNAGNTIVRDPNGFSTTHFYDSSLRPTRTTDPLGNNVSATYTSNSNVETYTGGSGSVTQSGYDANFNLTSARLPTGATSRWEYGSPTHKFLSTKAIDPQGNATSFTYDSRTNVTSLTNALAGQATYTYNTNGTVATARDFKGNLTSFTYDASSNLTAVDNPAPLGDITYGYDTLGRVIRVTEGILGIGSGQRTLFTYDALDRVTRIEYHDGSVITYAYDGDGNVTTMTDNTGTTTYEYDGLSRLKKETLPGLRILNYSYDAAGNLTSFADAGGTVSYGYNAANLLTTLTEPGGPQTTFTYDADHMRTQTNYPNGVSMFFTYDQSNRLTRVLGKKPASGTVLTDFVYSWTNGSAQDTGLRQSVTDKNGNKTSYTYDALNRLTRAETRTSGGTLTDSYAYSYDANSNRTSQTVSGATTNYTHNAADQLTAAGSTTFSYDGRGNETSNSAGRQWTYNAKNQAISVTPPGGAAIPMTYTGTGQSERVSAGSTTYTTNTLGLGRENTTAYTRDDGGVLLSMRTGSGSVYYLLDGLGSVAALTDSTGATAATYTYEPFGKLKSSTGAIANAYRWLGGAGVYFDSATGLYKMGTRYYDPSLGRFTQRDPIAGSSFNAYDYAGQDPINRQDCNGESPYAAAAIVACITICTYFTCPSDRIKYCADLVDKIPPLPFGMPADLTVFTTCLAIRCGREAARCAVACVSGKKPKASKPPKKASKTKRKKKHGRR